jgi:glutathione S-transferase
MITLYHCRGARSLRVIWTLEEMGLPYEPIMLPFPPRVHAKSYLVENPLGTVPLLIDGDVRMTESSGICLYLAQRHGPTSLAIASDEADYPGYLNWLFFSDATLTFPQTLVLRYRQFEPPERRNETVAADYEKWFFGRLRVLEAELQDREWLCGNRFTIADICIAYALHLADQRTGLGAGLTPAVKDYLARSHPRESFKRAQAVDGLAPDY